MVFLGVLLISVVFVFIYLFFAPFYLQINTDSNLYQLRFHKIASANLKIGDDVILLDIKILWWYKRIDLFNIKSSPSEKLPNKNVKKEKVKPKIMWRKIKAVLRSFKINSCIVSIDTGNVQLNGILFPFVYLFSVYVKKNIRINFINENKIILELENNLARMSWAYISS